MKTENEKKVRQNDSEDRMPGATAQIRDALRNVETELTCIAPDKRFQKVLKVLNKKDRKDIFQAVLEKFYNSEEFGPPIKTPGKSLMAG